MVDLLFVKETQYKNTCCKCGKEIPKGSSCFWIKGTKTNYHEACKPENKTEDPDITGNGKVPPPSQAGMKVTLMVDAALEKAIDEKAIRILDRAEAIVRKKYPNMDREDYSLYDHRIGAIYASLYGFEQSISIARQKGIR